VSDHPARLGPRFLTLACCGVRIGAWELEAEPRLWALVAEDAAWQIAVADWRARRPVRPRRRARRRWQREAVRHVAAGKRLARLAADLGCATRPRRVTLS
jgi:hypothetical protein